MRRGVLSASAPVLTRAHTGPLGDTVMVDWEAAWRPATSASTPHTRSLPSLIAVRQRGTPPTADVERSLTLMTRPRLGELSVLLEAEARRQALAERLERVHTFERDKLERRRAELAGIHQHEVKLRKLEQAVDSLRATNEERIARVRARTQEKVAQAAEKRDSTLEGNAAKAGAMYSAHARSLDEYHMASPPDHEPGEQLSQSQVSPRSRAELSSTLELRRQRSEAGRQKTAEEQARQLDERQRKREATTQETKARKAERQLRSFGHLEERERSVAERLQDRAEMHAAEVRKARAEEAQHSAEVFTRHEAQLESKLERTQKEVRAAPVGFAPCMWGGGRPPAPGGSGRPPAPCIGGGTAPSPMHGGGGTAPRPMH